jgi:hypothetical protein
VDLKVLFTNVDARPYLFHQLVLADDAPGILNQAIENSKGFPR